jgi:penicillin amidase
LAIDDHPRDVTIGGRTVRIGRTTGGAAALWADDDLGLAAGQGYAHAHDRLVQMELVRLVAQGRLCECLLDDGANLEIDVFMRRMGFAALVDADAARLTEPARALLEAYCEGVNHAVRARRRPLELRLAGHRPRPWRPQDVLLTAQIMSFVGLAQTQLDLEKMLVQALRAGVDATRLRALFAPHLDGLDDAVLGLIARVRIEEGLLPASVRWLAALPRVSASNNWALAPSRSASGAALQCNDPHLEINRLPAIWYEMVGHTRDDYRIGISMPGLPGLVMGRTRAVSFGFTYGFMDTFDYFIEEVGGGCSRESVGWVPLARRAETVKRRKNPPLELTVFATGRGTLETAPRASAVEDGLYLSRAWSNQLTGAAPTIDAVARLLRARSAEEAQAAVRDVTVSCNWILADRDGHIAYQQSGALPRRRHSGLHPVPGWRDDLTWQGIEPSDRLAARLDPPEGVLVTANDDQAQEGRPRAINACMGPYRARRIAELLAARERHTVADMLAVQNDLFSPQADCFLKALRPLLPQSTAADVLRAWDLRYDARSQGASAFEEVYAGLLDEVFGRGLFGQDVWRAITGETVLLTDYFHYFDVVLLEGGPEWFGGEGREAVFRRVLDRVLGRRDAATVPPWRERRQVVMTNVFFRGKLPRFFRADHGPVTLQGGRATVAQGGLFRMHGRTTTFAPSWRYATDLGRDEALTAVAGGPSESPFSRHYLTGVDDWLAGRYKRLRAQPAGPDA